MAHPPKSYLLEQLRLQADSVSARRVQEQRLSREVIERVDRRLHAVFQYFDEACKLLQTIAPRIEREFVLPEIARYSDLVFDRGLVMFRKQPLRARGLRLCRRLLHADRPGTAAAACRDAPLS
jgi:hypothetical protein